MSGNETRARDLLLRKKKLIKERDDLVLDTKFRASYDPEKIPFTRPAIERMHEIWTSVLKIDKALLRSGVSDLNAHRIKA